MIVGFLSLLLATSPMARAATDHYCGRTEWIDPRSNRAVTSFQVCLKIENDPARGLIIQSNYRELYGANEDIVAGVTILEGREGSRFVEAGHEAGRRVRGDYVMSGSAWNWDGWRALRRFDTGNSQRIVARRNGSSVDIDSTMISALGFELAMMKGRYERISSTEFETRVRNMRPRKR